MLRKYDLSSESQEDVAALCAECRRETHHEVLNRLDDAGGDEDFRWWAEYRFLRCRGCDHISYHATTQDTEDIAYDGQLERHVDMYPALQKRRALAGYEDLPWEVAAIYDEVLKSFNVSLRVLAAMGVRALIEVICDDRECASGELYKRIDELVEQQVLPKHHADVLHQIRFLGNDAAHDGYAPRAKELSDALDAVEDVLRTVYLLPGIAERMQRERERRKPKA